MKLEELRRKVEEKERIAEEARLAELQSYNAKNFGPKSSYDNRKY